ncbi:hypothetical protein ACTHPH_21885 [Paenibacillus pasadenensis]|uniref:hypothetical protein n=1 Tax=Paenibacillus pasadenensis TaxID=217090 RepID=UPI00041D400A|nr:hypothetical protein [Paenibacillus pasadenensis]
MRKNARYIASKYDMERRRGGWAVWDRLRQAWAIADPSIYGRKLDAVSAASVLNEAEEASHE